MKKSDIRPMPQFFDRYINLVEDTDIVEALQQYAVNTVDSEKGVLQALGGKRYAEDKWTVKDIFQHIIDNERIQAYRALRFARNDKSVLPGYDEKLFAAHADTAHRTVDDLLEEFKIVREASICLFKSFSDEMLLRTGICFDTTISVLALGFVIVGHQIHHLHIIKERYYPLL